MLLYRSILKDAGSVIAVKIKFKKFNWANDKMLLLHYSFLKYSH
ncbi:hypothetical protein SAMN05444277_10851 [Parafilimonas terrae]|uniref:Uncharacterized protein n=1 Tax=Parafilimonas terrae TaxID=1465490 RepID=A0A1I5XAH5_9BACT|nr:hypothetical protein SAMN05444277_10851 [Parafilimonas terrae]